MDDTDEPIICREIALNGGKLGLLQLNRPQALNALDEAMFLILTEHVKAWEFDPDVTLIAVTSLSEKAFCVGGDVVALYHLQRQQPDVIARYFKLEYQFNYLISQLKTPYLSWLDGMTMGGGVGISVHGSHRVATENVQWAMPETGIGFSPDIGATYFLNRAPGYSGFYLGLTGERITAGDVLYAGFADYFIPAQQKSLVWETILEASWDTEPHGLLDKILASYSQTVPESELKNKQAWIDHCFNQNAVTDILAALGDDPCLAGKSPMALLVAFEALRRGANLNLRECLNMEYGVSLKLLDHPDFYAGIGAYLVKKHGQPQWQHQHVNDVKDEEVAVFFDSNAMLF